VAEEIIRAVVGGGAARVVAAVTTRTVAEAARRHGTQAVATIALGRTVTAGLLLATLTKGDERVTVQILGDGPLGTLTADATGAGTVRGFLSRPGAPLPDRVGTAVGRGIVNVIRDLGLRERYSGSADLTSGEIDEDLESYLNVSEQVASALGCSVALAGGAVTGAGGVLVQSLPDGDVARVAAARRRLRDGVLGGALGAGTPLALVAAALGGLEGVDVVAAGPVAFRCGCSRARVLGALALLGPDELRAMVREDGGAEVTCDFCRERYEIGRAELERI
jgi:molecular chaperone Hsp33